MNAQTKVKSLGEERVRVDFNVTNDENVTLVKVKAAELINLVANLGPNQSWSDFRLAEFNRLKNKAMDAFEAGAMWGVKAATL